MNAPRIVLARDASHAWLELLPELRVPLRTDAEVEAFVLRAARHGFLVTADGACADYTIAAEARS